MAVKACVKEFHGERKSKKWLILCASQIPQVSTSSTYLDLDSRDNYNTSNKSPNLGYQAVRRLARGNISTLILLFNRKKDMARSHNEKFSALKQVF